MKGSPFCSLINKFFSLSLVKDLFEVLNDIFAALSAGICQGVVVSNIPMKWVGTMGHQVLNYFEVTL